MEKNFIVVCVDTRDDIYSRPSVFKVVAFATMEDAQKELYRRVMDDIESVMLTYDVQYDGEMYEMQEFKEEVLSKTDRLENRVAWYDGEGGIVEYSIHQI